MSNNRNKIAKNASALMGSQLITWVLTLTLTIFLPRYLGPEGVGTLHLANSLRAITIVFATFGLNYLVTKQIARTPQDAARLFGTTLWLRMGLFGIGFVILAGYVFLVDYSQETIIIVLTIGFSNLFMQVQRTSRAMLDGLERMEFTAITDIIGKVFSTILIIALLLLGYGLLPVAIAYVVTTFVTMSLQLYFLARQTTLSLAFDWTEGKAMLREGATYFSANIFRTLYTQVDVVVISLLVNETVVGWYGQADRLFGTLMFVPTVFITALFPQFSRLHKENPTELAKMMRRSFSLLLLISVPVGLGIFVVATNISVLLFGEAFRQTGPVLAIMGIVTILTYQTMLVGRYLIAIDRQKMWAGVLAVATLATIPLDLTLVPWAQATYGNGAIGGALAFVVTEGGMMLFGLYFLPKGTLNRETALQAAKVFTAGALMVAATWFIRDLFVAIPIIVGAVVYVSAALLLRAVPQAELQTARKMATKTLNKVVSRVRPA